LYNVHWPLARFYFDRAIYWWGNFVEGKINEAEARARVQTKRMRGNAEGFIASAKQAAYCKLLGLPLTSAYRSPNSFTKKADQSPKSKLQQSVSAEGRFDLSKFNG
jgi:hypothetical protein